MMSYRCANANVNEASLTRRTHLIQMKFLRVLLEEVDGDRVVPVPAVPSGELWSRAVLSVVFFRRVVERIVLAVTSEK